MARGCRKCLSAHPYETLCEYLARFVGNLNGIVSVELSGDTENSGGEQRGTAPFKSVARPCINGEKTR
jgi:hypothetical protein